MSYKILASTASKNYEFLLRHSNRIESYGKLESLIFDQSCILPKPQPQFMWMTRANKASYHVFFEGWTEKTKNMEIGSDWRPVRRQDHRPGQALDFLWELGMESLQVKKEEYFVQHLSCSLWRVPETATVLLGGGVNFADLPEWAQNEFQVQSHLFILRNSSSASATTLTNV